MMTEEEIQKAADGADIIVAGYAYTVTDGRIRVLNLYNTDSAAVLDYEGNMLATTMDDKELFLARSYYLRNREFIDFPSSASHAG